MTSELSSLTLVLTKKSIKKQNCHPRERGLTRRCSGGHEARFEWLLARSLAAPLNAGVMPRWRNAAAPSPLTLPTAISSVVAHANVALLNPPSGMTHTVTRGGPSLRESALRQTGHG